MSLDLNCERVPNLYIWSREIDHCLLACSATVV